MTVPTLSPRAARELHAFRQLLSAMASPGTVATTAPHEQGGRLAAAVTLLEAVLDHEVSFAVVPGDAQLEETILRLTGSRLAPLIEADYVLAWESGVVQALCYAQDGDPEYPDRGATVFAAIESVSAEPGQGEPVVLNGPGIRDTVTVWLRGFGPELRHVFRDRARELPLGLDLVLVGVDGRFTCLSRYTRIQEGD